MEAKTTCAVILARGGSKGLVDKNLRRVGNFSLLARSILACTRAGIKNVFVSSDAKDIQEEARCFGAHAHSRSAFNSRDESSSEDAIVEFLEYLSLIDLSPEFIVFVQPTSPFLFSSDIINCINNTMHGTSTFTAYLTGKFLWQKIDNVWEPLGHHKNKRLRRQEGFKRVIENGACYCFSKNDFLSIKSRFAEKVTPILVPEFRSIEIDTLEDLLVAQRLSLNIKCDWES